MKKIIEKKTLITDVAIRDRVSKALDWKDGDPEDDRLDEDDVIVESAMFDNGFSADIKCCGVQYEQGSDNSAWCEMVLFNEANSEVACTDVADEFFGEWSLEYNGKEYVVDVVEAKEE